MTSQVVQNLRLQCREKSTFAAKELNPNTNIHVLLTVLHIVLMVLVGRICVNIETLYPW